MAWFNKLMAAVPSHTKRQQLIHRLKRPAWLGTLRRMTPLSDHWGFERGTPIDRGYIERFLAANQSDIQGSVLEIKNNTYTQRFGSNIIRSDVLDIDSTNPNATMIADLADPTNLPTDTYDCFICTQTLQYIYPIPAAIANARRLLRCGGVFLATVPCIIKADPKFAGSDYWRLTVDSCKALFGEAFGQEHLQVQTYGNILTAIAFLMGMAREELSPHELELSDPAFPVVIVIRAVKSC